MKQRGIKAIVACGALVLTASASEVGAQVDAQKQAAARALFDQARELGDQGNFAAACPKLEESLRLDPGIGTLFHLANCYEQTGRPASAWSLFLQVAAQARASNQADREEAARSRAKLLEPRVPKLVIVVPAELHTAGLEIRRDGEVVGKGAWGAPIPADPGSHTIEVTAPGKKKSTAKVTVPTGGQSVTYEIKRLEDAPVPQAPAASAPQAPASAQGSAAPVVPETPPGAPPSDGSSQRLAGLAVGGVGIVGLAVSGVLALSAKSRYDEAAPNCSGNLCDQVGQDIHDEARSRGNGATVVGVIGLVAVAGGAVLYLTAPSGARQTTGRAGTWVAAGPGSFYLGGRW